jgi:hypothetical protein
MKTARSTNAFIVMFAGLIACVVHFTLMYAVATLACLQSQSIEPAFNIRIALIAITTIVLGALAVYLVRGVHISGRVSAFPDDEARQFLSYVTVALGSSAEARAWWSCR